MKTEQNERNFVDEAIYRNIVKERFCFSTNQRDYDVLDIVLRIANDKLEHTLQALEVSMAKGCSLQTVGDVARYPEDAFSGVREILSCGNIERLSISRVQRCCSIRLTIV
ncbi:hypothetical protein VCHA43P277_160129 [Vibrio chagasii]|nr:hypothetical protein BK411_13050 [Vibrio splendidus]CAH6817091.1 hypothetical protein VCHA34P126_140048 [Vibrio chagasii]CAH6989968.1 hypothetical protein VCHA43P277_160129 [Vibrio chagasii]CAH7037862.1 hypothetical protein VCHA41O247_160130 [Vibrio chagasii]